jgi:HAD superfamily hydrolase (TIGR01509 family)
MSPRALIFDYDGLIVDSEAIVAAQLVEVLAERGVAVGTADVGHLFGGSGRDPYEAWRRFLMERLGPAVDVGELDRLLADRSGPLLGAAPLLPGAAELVAAARAAGWLLGLATGRRRADLAADLRRTGLTGAFDGVVTVEDVRHGKPAPDLFLAAAERLGVPPGRAVVLEDSLPGYWAALAAGMRVVVCPSSVTAHCSFPEAALRVDALCAMDLDELGRLLDAGP